MNNEKKNELKKLIESVVEEALLEQQTTLLKEGDDVIYKAFIQPFADVIDTAVHSTKTLATKSGSELLKLAKMSTMSLLPFVGPEELDEIENEFDSKLNNYLQGLDDEYKDVLQRNIDALGTTDAKGFSFFLRPDLFFAKEIATGTPVVALDFLDTITLGNPKVKKLKNKFANIHKRKNPPGAGGGPLSTGGGGGAGSYVDYDMGDGGLEEAATNPKLQMKKEIQALLKDPEIIQAMKNNPVIKDVAKLKAQSVIDRASKVLKSNSFEDIKKHMGPEGEKLEQEATKNFPPEATPEEKDKLLQSMVPEFKNMLKQIYKNYLTNLLNLDSLYPEDIKNAIKKIDQLG